MQSKVVEKIYNYFQSKYPQGPSWQESSFHCFRQDPLELKLLIFHDEIEDEISNGGLPQLLWNCFGCWRELLTISKTGYELIGALDQAAAIPVFFEILLANERDCISYMQKAEDDFKWFGEWCCDADERMDNVIEELFYSNSGVFGKRLRWIEKNKYRINQLLKA